MFETPAEFSRRVGSLELGPELVIRTRGEVWGRFAIAAVLVGGFLAATLALTPLSPWPPWPTTLACLSAFLLYCALGYFVHARPNHDELGVLSLRHELRVSDDVNRAMLLARIVLALGRFVAISVVDFVTLLLRRQLPQDRYVERARAKQAASADHKAAP